MLISVPLLTVTFCAAALWGGFWVAKLSGLLESNFVLSRLSSSLDVTIWKNVMVRAVVFAFVIGAVSCHHGLRVKVSATEVPQQATRGVIGALSLCFLSNLALSLAVL
jgi:phospholipid/cholesterol/gamma-HCH transport system permease protein